MSRNHCEATQPGGRQCNRHLTTISVTTHGDIGEIFLHELVAEGHIYRNDHWNQLLKRDWHGDMISPKRGLTLGGGSRAWFSTVTTPFPTSFSRKIANFASSDLPQGRVYGYQPQYISERYAPRECACAIKSQFSVTRWLHGGYEKDGT